MSHVLHRKVAHPDHSGLPIPHSIRTFTNNDIEFRRSELSVIYAVAGMGKSSLALTIAVSCKQPTLYISADTNSRDQAVRTLSVVTGRPNNEMVVAIDEYKPWAIQELKKAAHIRWVFDSAPTMESIEDELTAFVEMHGEPPALMLVDNATDVVIEGAGDEWGTLRELFRALKYIAREYNTAVVALHHASEKDEIWEQRSARPRSICPPRSQMQGKVSQVPALILSMASTNGWMAVCPVKNRFGWADPSGNTPCMLDWEPASTFIADNETGVLEP